MKLYSVLFISCLLPVSTMASSLDNVQIVNLNVNRDMGQVYIRTSTAPVLNGCHIDLNWNYTFLISSEADKAVYSTLLAAKMGGESVDLVGYGNCPSTGYQNVEELHNVTISN